MLRRARPILRATSIRKLSSQQVKLKPLPSPVEADQILRKELGKTNLISSWKSLRIEPFRPDIAYWASSYEIHVDGMPRYVGRMVSDYNQNEMQFSFLTHEQGLSPKIHHYNLDSGVMIRDYVKNTEKNALDVYMLLSSYGELLKKFSKLTVAFEVKDPAIFSHYCCIAHSQIQDPVIEKIVNRFNVLDTEPSLRSQTQTLMHGDFHPGNILYDNNRFWLIDFEFSNTGSSLVDLATMAIFLKLNAHQEYHLLESFFGKVNHEHLSQYFQCKEVAALRNAIIYTGLRENVLTNPIKREAYTLNINSFFKMSVQAKQESVNYQQLSYSNRSKSC